MKCASTSTSPPHPQVKKANKPPFPPFQRSYAPDYLGLALLATAYTLIVLLVIPFHRLFALTDLAIAFPHAEHERVPVFLNVLIAGALPLLLVTALNAALPAPARASGSRTHKHHVTILGLLIALALTSFLTDTLKNAVGRPRPDLLARCKAAPGTPHDVLVGIEVCTETRRHVLHDGWRSFPSGHSSFSFAGLGYLSLFLAGQTRVFVVGGGEEGKAVFSRGDLSRALLCLSPLLGAAMIAVSRCQDYRHDVYDVTFGAALGYTVAYWSYRRYWPGLSSWKCQEPYPGPSGGEDIAYGRLRDEEEGAARRTNDVGFEMDQLPVG